MDGAAPVPQGPPGLTQQSPASGARTPDFVAIQAWPHTASGDIHGDDTPRDVAEHVVCSKLRDEDVVRLPYGALSTSAPLCQAASRPQYGSSLLQAAWGVQATRARSGDADKASTPQGVMAQASQLRAAHGAEELVRMPRGLLSTDAPARRPATCGGSEDSGASAQVPPPPGFVVPWGAAGYPLQRGAVYSGECGARRLDSCASVGSIGHPHTCAEACKFHSKARGCKDGAMCTRCHICRWTRHSKKKEGTANHPATMTNSIFDGAVGRQG